MATHSNRQMRLMVLEERDAKNKILEEAKKLKGQLEVVSNQFEYSREKNGRLQAKMNAIESNKWFKIGRFFKLI